MQLFDLSIVAQLLLFLFASALPGYSNVGKSKNLVMTAIMPMTQANVDFPVCLAAMQVVADVANSRSDILPDYQISIQPLNEGISGIVAGRSFMDFYRQFEEKRQADTYFAPIVLGPTTGCQSISYALKMMYISQYSIQCNGLYVIAHKYQYSTLYRFMVETNGEIWGITLFAIEVGWKQIGILASYSNINLILGAQAILELALNNRQEVVYYGLDDGSVSDETMVQMKQSKTRYAVVVLDGPLMTVRFMCQSYKHGMTAPNYVFSMSAASYVSPETNLPRPSWCTREMLRAQARILFYGGVNRVKIQFTNRTTLGYDANWYLGQLNKALTGIKATDLQTRSMCHDVALGAVLALNNSETVLREIYNRSLMDFASLPELVGNVVNVSSNDLDFTGLRIGRMKWSRQKELMNDEIVIQQYDPSIDDLLVRYRMFPRNRNTNGTIVDLTGSSVIEVMKPNWTTRSGLPPKDLSNIIHIEQLAPPVLLGVLSSLGIASFVIHIPEAILIARRWRDYPTLGYFDGFSCVTMFVGFFTLDTACAVLPLGTIYFPDAECILRFVMPAIGVSLVEAVLLTQSAAYVVLLDVVSRMRRRLINLRSKVGASSMMFIYALKQARTSDGITIILSTGVHNSVIISIVSINATVAILLLAWNLHSVPKYVAVFSLVDYDEQMDNYFDLVSYFCSSKYQADWLAVIVAFDSFLVVLASCCAFRLGLLTPDAKIRSCNISYVKIAKTLRLCVLNTTILVVGVLLIIIALGLSNRNAWLPGVFLAFGVVAFAQSTSGILVRCFSQL